MSHNDLVRCDLKRSINWHTSAVPRASQGQERSVAHDSPAHPHNWYSPVYSQQYASFPSLSSFSLSLWNISYLEWNISMSFNLHPLCRHVYTQQYAYFLPLSSCYSSLEYFINLEWNGSLLFIFIYYVAYTSLHEMPSSPTFIILSLQNTSYLQWNSSI